MHSLKGFERDVVRSEHLRGDRFLQALQSVFQFGQPIRNGRPTTAPHGAKIRPLPV
ncbi:hypothetical protein [Archangium violaceum]|uniref:hypothetical protein n=1 Tax=Archangium violaceum TaxID=83451 RepID=UPI0013640212|nr:hypothetical protein [Archangium violaceum]